MKFTFWQKRLFIKNSRALKKPLAKGWKSVNSVFFRYISSLYLKSFFIIFAALIVFFVGIDLLINFKDLPNSANLILLYTFFLACMATSYVLPISLAFAFIMCLVSMVRSNELVSLYALGLSKKKVVKYPFYWALFFCAVFIVLNFSGFAYAEDYRGNILRNAQVGAQSEDIFLKFDDKFVYIERLESLNDRVNNMKIFDIEGLNLRSLIDVQSAIFKDNAWLLERAELITPPSALTLYSEGLKTQGFEQVSALKGFKPRIIENVANKSHYSITDAAVILAAFSRQNINTTPIRTELYKLIFTPLFVPFLMLLLQQFFPATSRFYNLAFVAFSFCTLVLGLWGVLYLLTKFTENGIIRPELGIILPVFVVIIVSTFIFNRGVLGKRALFV